MQSVEEVRRCRNVFCNEVLVKRDDEKPSQFKNRIFCNRSCSNSSPSSSKVTKKGRVKQKFYSVADKGKVILPYKENV